MSNVVVRAFEAARAPLVRRPKVIALVGAIVSIAGWWAGRGFWAGFGFGLLVLGMIKVLADRRG
jgi:hypothetical protein